MIRPARLADAAELARLTSLLGYPADVTTLRRRLDHLLGSPIDHVLVAEAEGTAPTTAEGVELTGWIHGCLGQLLESQYRVEIGGLIVDARWRRRGIGQALVRSLEAWATERGAREMSVRCRIEREDAHRFYERLAFRGAKTQRVFRKTLNAPER